MQSKPQFRANPFNPSIEEGQKPTKKGMLSKSFSLTGLKELPKVQNGDKLQRRYELSYFEPVKNDGSKKESQKEVKIILTVLRSLPEPGSDTVIRFSGTFQSGKTCVEATGYWSKAGKSGMLMF